VCKISKMISKKQMTVRKFEKKWVPHGHIMVYKWVSNQKREGDDEHSGMPSGPMPGYAGGDYGYVGEMQSMRHVGQIAGGPAR
jgi:hypothetical protein